jgi:hypothetical protein
VIGCLGAWVPERFSAGAERAESLTRATRSSDGGAATIDATVRADSVAGQSLESFAETAGPFVDGS